MVYGWWVSGTPAFTVTSALAVVVPGALLLVAALAAPRRDEGPGVGPDDATVTFRSVVPWLVLLSSAVVLEALGLASGGRSAAVPTLSTVVDHALVDRFPRFLLCCAWLGIGLLAASRLAPVDRP